MSNRKDYLYCLVDTFNDLVDNLKAAGLKIYDTEDPDWTLNKIVYDQEKDKLLAHFKPAKPVRPGKPVKATAIDIITYESMFRRDEL